MLKIRCFGTFLVEQNGEAITGLNQRCADRLLGYLLAHPDREILAGDLAEAVWPKGVDADLERATPRQRAMNSFHQARPILFKCLPEAEKYLKPAYGAFMLCSEDIQADILDLDSTLRRGHRGDVVALREACDLYRGMIGAETQLFEGWEDDWVRTARLSRRDSWLKALRELAKHERSAHNFEAAAERLTTYVDERLVDLEPVSRSDWQNLMESVLMSDWQDLMENWILSGEPLKAMIVFRLCRARLSAVGLEPPEIMMRWYDQIIRRLRPVECHRFQQPGGSELPTSSLYVERDADNEFRSAIALSAGVVLVAGSRQVGKSSLLARGILQARELGRNAVLTDLQAIDASEFESPERLYRAIEISIAEQLELDVDPASLWKSSLTPNFNLERFIRQQVLKRFDGQFVWFLDEADRLFHCPFKNDIFSLFRSWYNKRAHDPDWGRFTQVIAYATEAHLFITDLHQSPFNVGTRLRLSDFTRDQIVTLNARHGSPLHSDFEIDRLIKLVGGHPYLVRCVLYEIANNNLDLIDVEAGALGEQSIFRSHLDRLLEVLQRDTEMSEIVRKMIKSDPALPEAIFYRLRSGGILVGETAENARFRCGLYQRFLREYL